MENTVFLKTTSSFIEYKQSHQLKLSLESIITYSIYKYCCPQSVLVKFVYNEERTDNLQILLKVDHIDFVPKSEIPWQVSACVFPVVMYEDTVITGLCAVSRHICKFTSTSACSLEHQDGILGFRKSCLQTPNEVSVWTKFCELEMINTVALLVSSQSIEEVPLHLLRFENHLNLPVRVHNVYKIAQDIKKQSVQDINDSDKIKLNKSSDERQGLVNMKSDNNRLSKARKWKSNIKKEIEIDTSIKIEDLKIAHQFAEGPFVTVADLVLIPSYYIIVESIGSNKFQTLLPTTYTWYTNFINLPKFENFIKTLTNLTINRFDVSVNIPRPLTDNVTLYKCDPKRHNPKKRLFTKELDIEQALKNILEGMEKNIIYKEFTDNIQWKDIPDGANPLAGHLPDERMVRKSQQLENLAVAVLNIAKPGNKIVDFCSGSGHLGILIAYLLPNCTIILLENKEQSLLRARQRVHKMGLKNVYFYQCNLDFFIGNFDIGVALHACGIASDLVLDKCLKVKAKFVLCPCCYGSLHVTDRLVYPRSKRFSNLPIDQYICIGHAADQTHEEHPLKIRGDRCMAIIDSDRARLAEENGYDVTLSRLEPLTCTPKNDLLIGLPG